MIWSEWERTGIEDDVVLQGARAVEQVHWDKVGAGLRPSESGLFPVVSLSFRATESVLKTW